MAAVCARLGRIPAPDEYLAMVGDKLSKDASSIYRYLSFDQMPGYAPKKVIPIVEAA
ncbi:aconitate hydratase B [Novimethylophilus kurashikiensis]|uniref:Aconitate hydratase B n=1 Tax=Novimethylophilus kurashikiensis TaxID=1825523 RepID=A0A2R5FFC5_9PROT|nr:aconitate hydratase B [Novimethylophilus kurashikiensis]